MLIVLTTMPTAEDAESLARALVEARLAACVQVMPAMRSFYFWDGAVQADDERLLLVKTTTAQYAALEEFIRDNHPYEVPEIVAVAAEKVSAGYRRWLEDYLEGN